jgi:poly-gamma-glutamate synthesis protein (capsule biosynthesis protein)
VPAAHIRFAHRLIDSGVDIVHGHSSHHPRPIEVYRRRLIFYGCGDFLNDYEGISGFELYRADLVLMYFATLDPASGDLIQLRMAPMQIRKMRLNRAAPHDASWLASRIGRISVHFGAWAEMAEAGDLVLHWE